MTTATLLSDKQLLIVGGVAVVGIGLLVFGVSRLGKAATETVGGAITGKNALTEGTAYDGAGIVGTLAGAADAAAGGALSSVGSAIGQTLFDWFGPSYDPNATTL